MIAKSATENPTQRPVACDGEGHGAGQVHNDSTGERVPDVGKQVDYEAVSICGSKRGRDREYRPRGENRPVTPIILPSGKDLRMAQRDALTRWLPEEQRQRAFAECCLIADVLIGPWRKAGPHHHCDFRIFDGLPSSRELSGGRRRHFRPTVAEASGIHVGLGVHGTRLDSRQSILAQTAGFLRLRAAELIASAERIERAEAAGGKAVG
jgi:hypothetical protein